MAVQPHREFHTLGHVVLSLELNGDKLRLMSSSRTGALYTDGNPPPGVCVRVCVRVCVTCSCDPCCSTVSIMINDNIHITVFLVDISCCVPLCYTVHIKL